MPRRAAQTTFEQDIQANTNFTLQDHASALPENVVRLRSHWKWAAFSQFFHTFAHVFAMEDVTVNDIEHELTHADSSAVLPRIMRRLLQVLTQDRKLTPDNWQTALRKQYLRRDPQANPIGNEAEVRYVNDRRSISLPGDASDAGQNDTPSVAADIEMEDGEPNPHETAPRNAEPLQDATHTSDSGQFDVEQEQEAKDWTMLDMSTKLDSLHLLIEWQFQNPMRFRTAMRNNDDWAEWRIEPIGYDSKLNAYWFIGNERLWIQRPLPKPKTLKRKRPPAKSTAKSKGKGKQPTKRTRAQPSPTMEAPESPTTGRGRAAKTQANKKLDAQAKELAELNRLAGISGARSSARGKAKQASSMRPLGTRLSARLRGTDDEWQALPEEWMEPSSSNTGKQPKKSAVEKPVAADSDSDLTELSEDEPVETKHEPEEESEEKPEPPEEEESSPAEGFIEWETIAVTLHEWEHVADRFANATHYAEKALYKVLTNDIVPSVTGKLREIVRQQQLEAAIVHRKRSSRIATKESEKEEARSAAMKRAEENEKMSRGRRMELRQQKEDADREKRELTREQRMKERETKERLQAEKLEAEKLKAENSSKPVASSSSKASAIPKTSEYKQSSNGYATTSSGSGSRTPAEESWELNCEVCHRRGFNLDDGVPMMSCGSCSIWQHIRCHDVADAKAGRPKRNWNVEEFYCYKCRQATAAAHSRQYPSANGLYIPPANGAYMPPPRNGTYLSPANGSSAHSHSNGTYAAPKQNNGIPSAAQSFGQTPTEFSHYRSSTVDRTPASSYTSPSADEFARFAPSTSYNPPMGYQQSQARTDTHVHYNAMPMAETWQPLQSSSTSHYRS